MTSSSKFSFSKWPFSSNIKIHCYVVHATIVSKIVQSSRYPLNEIMFELFQDVRERVIFTLWKRLTVPARRPKKFTILDVYMANLSFTHLYETMSNRFSAVSACIRGMA